MARFCNVTGDMLNHFCTFANCIFIAVLDSLIILLENVVFIGILPNKVQYPSFVFLRIYNKGQYI